MIELTRDTLIFSFLDLHPDAHCTISFQRTLRIPDDDKTWPLPPGLGRFPIVHVDDLPRIYQRAGTNTAGHFPDVSIGSDVAFLLPYPLSIRGEGCSR